MEKIQTLPIEVLNKAQKASVPVNEEEFALQFQKFSHMTDEESSKESGLQTSTDSAPTESVENKEELENEDRVFTLINPFLHIQTEAIDAKTVEMSESHLALEADVRTKDNTFEKQVVNFGQSEKPIEPVSYHHSQISQTSILNEQNPELGDQLLNAPLVEPTEQVMVNDKSSIQPIETADLKEPASVIMDVKQDDRPLNHSDKSHETTQPVDAFDQLLQSAKIEETNRALKSVEPKLNSEDENKLPVSQLTHSDEEETLPHTFTLNEITQTSEAISKPVQSTPSQTIPVVTKEEGMEMIKEMVTETLVDDNGVETVRSTIKLTPESLGEVEIELISTDKGLTGKIVFQSEEAKQWMEKEWEQFKLPLETKGVSFQALELTVSQPIQNHTIQNPLGEFSFAENFSQSQQDQPANQQANHGEGVMTKEDTENNLEQVDTQPLNGLNVYV